MAAIRHIVLFRFDEGIEVEQQFEAIRKIQRLSVLPGILEWRLETSMDERKGDIVVQNVLFESDEAFAAYRASDGHKAVGLAMSGISNWLIADYKD